MENNILENRMKKEIRSRMESRSWNLNIASAVMEKKKRSKNRFILFSTSAVSLAAVSMLMFIILFGIKEQADRIKYSDVVSIQLKGTYNSVFSDNSKTGTEPGKKEGIVAQQVQGTFKTVFNDKAASESRIQTAGDIFTSDVDSMIDNTLALR